MSQSDISHQRISQQYNKYQMNDSSSEESQISPKNYKLNLQNQDSFLQNSMQTKSKFQGQDDPSPQQCGGKMLEIFKKNNQLQLQNFSNSTPSSDLKNKLGESESEDDEEVVMLEDEEDEGQKYDQNNELESEEADDSILRKSDFKAPIARVATNLNTCSGEKNQIQQSDYKDQIRNMFDEKLSFMQQKFDDSSLLAHNKINENQNPNILNKDENSLESRLQNIRQGLNFDYFSKNIQEQNQFKSQPIIQQQNKSHDQQKENNFTLMDGEINNEISSYQNHLKNKIISRVSSSKKQISQTIGALKIYEDDKLQNEDQTAENLIQSSSIKINQIEKILQKSELTNEVKQDRGQMNPAELDLNFYQFTMNKNMALSPPSQDQNQFSGYDNFQFLQNSQLDQSNSQTNYDNLANSQLNHMNQSQIRDKSSEKIFTKVGLRQCSNDSQKQKKLQMQNQEKYDYNIISGKIYVQQEQSIENEFSINFDQNLRNNQQNDNKHQSFTMESELFNLQKKIMDLEQKLNKGSVETSTNNLLPPRLNQHKDDKIQKVQKIEKKFPVNGGSGESEDNNTLSENSLKFKQIQTNQNQSSQNEFQDENQKQINNLTSEKTNLIKSEGSMSNIIFTSENGIFGNNQLLSSMGPTQQTNDDLKESALNLNSNGRLYHRYNEIMEQIRKNEEEQEKQIENHLSLQVDKTKNISSLGLKNVLQNESQNCFFMDTRRSTAGSKISLGSQVFKSQANLANKTKNQADTLKMRPQSNCSSKNNKNIQNSFQKCKESQYKTQQKEDPNKLKKDLKLKSSGMSIGSNKSSKARRIDSLSNRLTSSHLAKVKENKPHHDFLKRSRSSLNEGLLKFKSDVSKIDKSMLTGLKKSQNPFDQTNGKEAYNQKIISKSSIPKQIKNQNDEKQKEQDEPIHDSDYMKETAQKVVELQRTVMKLKAQLKIKQDVELVNEKLENEVSQLKSKCVEFQKKQTKCVEHVKELKSLLEEQIKINTDLKKKIKKIESQPNGTKRK